MAKDILAIYDPCQVYLERFVGFVSEHADLGCRAQGYTDLSILAEKLQSEKIDAVLLALDENCKQSFRENEGFLAGLERFDGLVLFMGRQQGSAGWSAFLKEAGYEGEIRYIYRYQSAQEIVRQIRTFLLQEQDQSEAEDPGLPISLAGMYSPVDKVSHPHAAAAIVKDQGKTLYINLEPFSGCSALLQEKNCSLSDVLYCYKTTPARLAEVLFKTVGQAWGMDVLTAPDDLDDLEELSERDWPEFLRAVTRAGDYHTIFLDMSVFQWKLIDVILSYGNLYIPALPYDPAATFRSVLIRRNGSEQEARFMQAAKMKEFREYFTARGMEEELRRIREVQIEPGDGGLR